MRLTRLLVILRSLSPLLPLLLAPRPMRRRRSIAISLALIAASCLALAAAFALLGTGLYRWLSVTFNPAATAALTGLASLVLAALLAGVAMILLRPRTPLRAAAPPAEKPSLLPPQIEHWLKTHPDGVRLATALIGLLLPEKRG